MRSTKDAGLVHLSFSKKTGIHTFKNKKGERIYLKNDKERKGSGLRYKNCFLKPTAK